MDSAIPADNLSLMPVDALALYAGTHLKVFGYTQSPPKRRLTRPRTRPLAAVVEKSRALFGGHRAELHAGCPVRRKKRKRFRFFRTGAHRSVTSQVKGYPFEVRVPQGYEVSGVILTDE